MLVKRHVFEAIGEPHFRNWDDTTINEDFVFCRRVREAGFKIMVDPMLQITHIGQVSAFPELVEGKWGLSLDLGGANIHIPNGIKLEGGLEKGQDPWHLRSAATRHWSSSRGR